MVSSVISSIISRKVPMPLLLLSINETFLLFYFFIWTLFNYSRSTYRYLCFPQSVLSLEVDCFFTFYFNLFFDDIIIPPFLFSLFTYFQHLLFLLELDDNFLHYFFKVFNRAHTGVIGFIISSKSISIVSGKLNKCYFPLFT